MDEERTKIMEMVAAGTISVEEADQLLEALDAAPADGETQRLDAPQPAERPAPPQPDRGAGNWSLDQLMQMRMFGVDSAFIREMREAGFGDLSLDKLIEMGVHGVDADF